MLRVTRFTLRVLIGLSLLSALLLAWILTSESGARWILGRVETVLPDSLSIAGISGTLLAGLEVEEVTWRDPVTEVTLRRARLDIALPALLARRVELVSLDAASLTVRVEGAYPPAEEPGTGRFELPVTIAIGEGRLSNVLVVVQGLELAADRVVIAATLDDADLALERLSVSSPLADLEATGEIEILGPFRANLTAAWKTSADGHAYAGVLALSGDVADYSVRHRLDAPVTLDSRGRIGFTDDGIEGDLVNQFDEIRWPPGSAEGVALRDGRFTVSGRPGNYVAGGVTSLLVPGYPEAGVEIDGSGSLAGFDFTTLAARSEAGRVLANGSFAWSPRPEWDFDFTAEGIDPSSFATAPAGSLDAAGETRGHWSAADSHEIGLVLSSLTGSVAGTPVDGELAATSTDGTIDVSALRVTSGSNTLTASGRVGETLDIRGEIDAPALASVHPDASGSAHASIRVEGRLERPSVRAQIDGKDVAFRAYGAELLDVDARLADDRAELTVKGEQAHIAGAVIDSLEARLAGRREGHELSVDASYRDVSASLKLSGGFDGELWQGNLDALGVSGPRIGEWALDGRASLSVAQDRVSLGRSCLERRATEGRACAEIDAAADTPLRFAVSVSELPVAILSPLMPQRVLADGRLFAEASGNASAGSLDAAAEVSIEDASVSATVDEEVETVRFDTLGARLRLESNRLEANADVALEGGLGSGSMRLAVTDVRDPDAPLSGEASLDIESLDIVSILVPVIVDTSGRLGGSLAVAGTVSAPALSGRIVLADGAFRAPPAGITVREINAELRQESPGTLAITGSAVSGKGRIAIDGRTTMHSATDLVTQIDVTGDGFEIVRLPDWQVSASPDVSVRVDRERISVTGDLLIPSADVTLNTIPETARRTSPDAIVHGREEEREAATRRTVVNVVATLGNDVRIEGFGLTARVDGSLRVQASPDNPLSGNGRLNLVGGRFESYGQELDIERGVFIFSGPLDRPLLDIRAVRRTEEVTVGIHLTGTPARLSSELFSEPEVSDAEQLSYLLTGRSLAAADSGDSDLLNKAAFAFGLSQAGNVASQIRTAVGLDVLSLEGGADDSRIVGGKRIGGSLFVEYGYGLVDRLGTLILRYQINERLSLESRTGSTTALDVVYKVRTQ